MNETIRMTRPQLARVKTLIRKRCCNCVDGNCLLLDDGHDPCPCPQMITYSLVCKWFRSAVLPGEKELYNEIVWQKGTRFCSACGKGFTPGSNRAKYCPDCSRLVRRRKEAERQRNRYYVRKGEEDGRKCSLTTEYRKDKELV